MYIPFWHLEIVFVKIYTFDHFFVAVMFTVCMYYNLNFKQRQALDVMLGTCFSDFFYQFTIS